MNLNLTSEQEIKYILGRIEFLIDQVSQHDLDTQEKIELYKLYRKMADDVFENDHVFVPELVSLNSDYEVIQYNSKKT